MKAVENIINGCWNLFIKDGNNILIRISAPNNFNGQEWRISLKCGICYNYKELSKALICLNNVLRNMYNTDASTITDKLNYSCELLMCFQDKTLDDTNV